MSMPEIMVYSTSWCPDCRRAVRVLDQNGASYRYVDIEQDAEAAAFVEQVNGGFRSVPTIIFPDGTRMVEPSNAELIGKLKSLNVPRA